MVGKPLQHEAVGAGLVYRENDHIAHGKTGDPGGFISGSYRPAPAFFCRMSGIDRPHSRVHLPIPFSSVSRHGCYRIVVPGIQPYVVSLKKHCIFQGFISIVQPNGTTHAPGSHRVTARYCGCVQTVHGTEGIKPKNDARFPSRDWAAIHYRLSRDILYE